MRTHKKTQRSSQGLTIPEVLFALVIIGVMTAVFSLALTSNMKAMQKTGKATQSAELLNYFGRRLLEGDSSLITSEKTPLSWDYGSLAQSFTGLASNQFSDIDKFNLSIVNNGDISLSSSKLSRYTLTVCSKVSDNESCSSAMTIAPSIENPVNSNQPLPVIN